MRWIGTAVPKSVNYFSIYKTNKLGKISAVLIMCAIVNLTDDVD